jgi:hypothetical protein
MFHASGVHEMEGLIPFKVSDADLFKNDVYGMYVREVVEASR